MLATLARTRPSPLVLSRGLTRALSVEPSQPWKVDPSEPAFEEKAAASILEHGFVVLPDLLSLESLSQLKQPLLENTEATFAVLDSKRCPLQVGSRLGFEEVVLRSPGRYDIPVPPRDAVPKAVQRTLEAITLRAIVPPADVAVASGGAGVPPTLTQAFAGLLRAQPGSPRQEWHADSAHLAAHHARPHLLNVLVALCDVPPASGPTELLPGSHTLTNHLRQGATFDAETLLYQSPAISPSTIQSTEEPVRACTPSIRTQPHRPPNPPPHKHAATAASSGASGMLRHARAGEQQ